MNERADLAQALTAAIPEALRLLRERAGYPTLRPAVQAIRRRTGYGIGRATLSAWERGTLPRFDLLIHFLIGLGYDLTHLQSALEEVVRHAQDPSATIDTCLRADPELRVWLRRAISESSIAERERAEQVIECLDRIDDLERGR